ncbi:MAG: hypothetical protein K2O58_05780 [Bacteroidales bacterium]|nr:hypothetical protein [Bacteroidales bacterium]
MKRIDIPTWDRRLQWEHFSKIRFPFYHVSFYIDVTPVKAYSKMHGISSYHTLSYLVCESLNSIENFRYRIHGDEVYLMDQCHPSMAVLPQGSSNFRILNSRMTGDIQSFCEKTAMLLENHTGFIGGEDIPEEECYFLSCLPWIDATCICSEHDLDTGDSTPRVSWGKYVKMSRGNASRTGQILSEIAGQQENGSRSGQRLWINMTVDVNHRLVDGYHIGLFAARLQEAIDLL